MKNDYSKAKMYKLVCNDTGMVYYGSTIQTLKRRLIRHKSNCKHDRSCSSKQIIKNDNYEMILIENYPCNSKKEAEAREGFYIRNNECINKNIPGRTEKEWYINNRAKILERCKEYKIINKDKIVKHNKEYKIINKDKINEKRRERYKKNKVKINEQRIERRRIKKLQNKNI